MSRRVLVVEPDPAGRAMIDRALTCAGFVPHTSASVREARSVLDDDALDVAVVDELGAGSALEDVRWLRAHYPTLPIVVMGALLSRRVMFELLRLGVADVLAKPFTPTELREAVTRAAARRTNLHEAGLEYDASITAARVALAHGELDEARPFLARAHAISPFDAEVMALYALSAELSGRDADADRGYRATLALRDEEACAAPDPHEGLGRLALYRGARAVASLSPSRTKLPVWIASDPTAELGKGTASEAGPRLLILSLGLSPDAGGALFFREGPSGGFVLLAAPLQPEPVAAALNAIGAGAGDASAATRERLDLARVAELRRESNP